MQTLVSVGPYRFHIAAAGQRVLQPREGGHRKDLAGKEDQPGRRVPGAVKLAVLGQKREDRRRRVPDADPPLGNEVTERDGVFAQVFTDQDQRRRGLASREQIEDRQIKMKRSM